MQSPQIQLLHVQTISNILAQSLLNRRPKKDMTHDDQVIWQLNRLYMVEGKGITWVWSVGFESGPGFAKCFTVTGFVVLT